MTRVEDGGQTNTRSQRSHHDSMHVIVNNMTSGSVVERIDHVIIAIILIAVQIGGTTAVTGEVNEEGVVRLSITNKPLHCAENVCLCGNTHGVALVIGENDHVLSAITKSLMQESGHIGDIVDAALERIRLPKIVNADQQRPAATGTSGVLELVIGWCPVAEMLQGLGWRRRQVRRV